MGKRILLISAALLFSVVYSLSSVDNFVVAKKGDNIFATSSFGSTAKKALAANILATCVQGYGSGVRTYPQQDINTMKGTGLTAATGISGFSTDDDTMNCKNLSNSTIVSTLKSLGYSGSSFRAILCDMGTGVTPSRSQCSASASGDLDVNFDNFGIAVSSKAPLNNAVAYYLGYQTLKKECGVEDLGVLGTDVSEGDKVSGDYTIFIINQKNGSGENHVYRIKNKDKTVNPFNTGNPLRPYAVKCKDMVMDHMNYSGANWVAAYSQYLKNNAPGTGEEPGTCEERYSASQSAELEACKDGYAHKSRPGYCDSTYTPGSADHTACTYGVSTATGATGTTEGETSSEGTGESEETCTIDGIGWLLCPVVEFMANMSDAVKSSIDQYLRVDSSKLTDRSDGSIYSYWAIARNYANILFVFAFIAIIYSQLTSVGISNYGVKKMLPKLIIGVLFVNVSFFICAAMVDLSNLIGSSSFNFIVNDVGSATTEGNVGSQGNTFTNVAVTILGGATILYFALGSLIAGLITVLFIGLATLILLGARQAIIIFTIILSPLAFVAWLLPNTEGLFKKWWSVFKAMLFVYPTIGILYGASSLASRILNDQYSRSDDGTSIAMQIVAAVLMFLPMLLVKKVVETAMNIGGISSMVGRFSGAVGGKVSGRAGAAGSKLSKAMQNNSFNRGLGEALSHRKNARQSRLLKRRAGASGFIGSIYNAAGGKGYGDRRAAIGAAAEEKEYNERVAAATSLQAGMTHQERMDIAQGKGKGASASAEERQAAVAYAMEAGDIYERRDTLESMEGVTDKRIRKTAAAGARKKGDTAIYGAAALGAVEDGKSEAQQGNSYKQILADSMLKRMESGAISGETMHGDKKAADMLRSAALGKRAEAGYSGKDEDFVKLADLDTGKRVDESGQEIKNATKVSEKGRETMRRSINSYQSTDAGARVGEDVKSVWRNI